jgi:hypothetical protein
MMVLKGTVKDYEHAQKRKKKQAWLDPKTDSHTQPI